MQKNSRSVDTIALDFAHQQERVAAAHEAEMSSMWVTVGRNNKFSLIDDKYNDLKDLHRVDIARALSHINRYGGNTPTPYSVAQHSILCELRARSMHVEMFGDGPAPCSIDELAFHCAMHDAQETFIGDVVSPMKRWLTHFDGAGADKRAIQRLEDRADAAAYGVFGVKWEKLAPVVAALVHKVDMEVLMVECKFLLPNSPPWKFPLFVLESAKDPNHFVNSVNTRGTPKYPLWPLAGGSCQDMAREWLEVALRARVRAGRISLKPI